MVETTTGEGTQWIYVLFAFTAIIASITLAILLVLWNSHRHLLQTFNAMQDRQRSLRRENDDLNLTITDLRTSLSAIEEKAEEQSRAHAIASRVQLMTAMQTWSEVISTMPGPNACVAIEQIAEDCEQAITTAITNHQTMKEIVENPYLPPSQQLTQIKLCLRNFPIQPLLDARSRRTALFADEPAVKESIEFSMLELRSTIKEVLARLQVSEEFIDSLIPQADTEDVQKLLQRN